MIKLNKKATRLVDSLGRVVGAPTWTFEMASGNPNIAWFRCKQTDELALKPHKKLGS